MPEAASPARICGSLKTAADDRRICADRFEGEANPESSPPVSTGVDEYGAVSVVDLQGNLVRRQRVVASLI
jgi:hypothetical protein